MLNNIYLLQLQLSEYLQDYRDHKKHRKAHSKAVLMFIFWSSVIKLEGIQPKDKVSNLQTF